MRLLPARFGSLIFRERRLGLLPGQTRHARRAPGIAALSLRLHDPATGGLRLLPEAFHAIPDPTQDASRLISRVEHIQAALQRRLALLLSLSLHRGDPGLQPLARVRRDERQRLPVA